MSGGPAKMKRMAATKPRRGARAAASGRGSAKRESADRKAAPHRTATPSSPDAAGESRLRDFVVITGFSGAGKSTAMNVFEDAGYFCVDNLPPEMIRSLVELFVHKGSRVEGAAGGSDA